MPRHRRWYDEGLLENRDIDEWAHILFFGGGINNIRSVEKITGVNREIVKDSMVYKWVYEYKDLEPERRIAIFDQNFHSTTALGGANRASPIQVRSPFWDLDLSKTINATEISVAALSPPKSPPRVLFKTPKDAKLASLVRAFPTKEITKKMERNVMTKAVMLTVFSDHSKCLTISAPA